MVTKEEIESLKKRASEVNNKIISLNTKKEIAQKEIQTLLEELGYDKNMSIEEVQNLVETLIKEETEQFNAFKTKVESTEKVIESLNID